MQSHLQVLKLVCICHKIIMCFYKYLLYHESITFCGTSTFLGKGFSPPVSYSAFVSELVEICKPQIFWGKKRISVPAPHLRSSS